MNESDPNPQNTYAVIVGIEKYDKSTDLSGAALSALNFAKWLSHRSVPNENIFLFISELDENKNLVETCQFNVRKAISSEIVDGVIFNEIRHKEGKEYILYIFWAGYGYIHISDLEDRRLLFSIEEKVQEKNLNLSNLLKSLKTDIFSCFNKQILLIDACAQYFPSSPSHKQLPDEQYVRGKLNKNCDQFVLLASKPGETAKYNNNSGLFSEVLLAELGKKKKLLLPEEMNEIAENVKIVFREDEKYKNEQTPIYLWFRDQDCNQESLGLTKSARTSILLEERWKDLLPILSEISDRYIFYPSCYFVLLEFSKDVNGDYPEINSLKSEATAQEDIPKILKNLLFRVMSNNKEAQAIFIVIKFVCWLLIILTKSEGTKRKLRKWNKETSDELNIIGIGIDIENIKLEIKKKISYSKKKYKQCHPYLIIVYQPKSSEKIYLSAELIFQKDNDKAELEFRIADQIEVALTNIHDKFDDFLLFSYRIIKLYGFTNEQLIVEIFLPNLQLVEPSEKSYEKIEIKTDIYNGRKWIGCHHKFVLRSFERLQNMDYTPLTTIKQKWDQLSNFKLNEQEIHQKIKWCKEDCNLSSNSDISGITLLSSSGINIMDLLRKQIIPEGLPLFIWIRSIYVEQLREELEKLLIGKNLNSLLENIKNKRLDAFRNEEQRQDSLGYHLGFLCDNPYRLPSQYSILGGDTVVDLGF